MLLTARQLGKTYGPRLLFRGITLGIARDDRAGLIGANGSGKSTLLRILAGLESPDEGTVERQRGLVVGYVPQQERFEPGATCLDTVSLAVVGAHDEHEREVAGEIALGRAGFADPRQPVASLSGGWRKRLAIVRELMRCSGGGVLLLDEPTNHLDLEGIEWLEEQLSGNFVGGIGGGGGGGLGVLMVSHDRRFLEETCNRTIELSRQYAEGFLSHDGTYSEFVEKREAFLAAQAGRQQALAGAVRREIAWLRRGAKARTTKARGRIDRAGEMMAELADLRRRNTAAGAAAVEFTASGRQTRKLIELRDVGKSVSGRVLFRGVSISLAPGTRLGLLGPNSSGKSTLIRVLTGQLPPDTGSVITADALRVVVFDQHREQLDPAQTLRRALSPAGDVLSFQGQSQHVSGWAKRFLFRTEQLDLPVGELSGGEQSRVLLARLMLRPADVLVLDEPTNDLDIPTLDVLEESLESFAGAVVLVTHDRYLMDRLCTSVLALDGRGGVSEYAELAQWERAVGGRRRSDGEPRRGDSTQPAAPARLPTADPARLPTAGPARLPTAAPASKPRLSWKEQRELDGIEAAIAAAEAEHARWQAATEDPRLLADHIRAREAFEKVAAAQVEVERLYARWADLEAKR